MAELSHGQFRELHAKLGTDGGFTVNAFHGTPREEGISVATHGNELRIPAAGSSPVDLQDYHQDAGNQERFDRGASFGGWRDKNGSGDDFIDTPTVYPNTPGGNRGARNQMIKSNQIAGFRLDDFQELTNPHHPENFNQEVSTSDHSDETVANWVEMPRSVTKHKTKPMRPTEGMSFS